ALDHGVVEHGFGGLGAVDFLAVHDLHFRCLLDVHHAHALADVAGGEVQHLARAGGVERHADVGHAGLLVVTLRSIDQFVAAHDDSLLQHHRTAVLHVVEAIIGRHVAGARRFLRVHALVFGVVFQRRHRAQHALGFGGVLHARQFHDDARFTLLLDQRFGYAEFIDAVAQRGDVLGDRGLGEFLHDVGFDRRGQRVTATRRTAVRQVEVGVVRRYCTHGVVAIGRGLEHRLHAVAALGYRVVGDLLLAQDRA